MLSAVKVESKLDDGLTKVGFSDRQRSTGAWFLTPDQIEKAKPLLTTDVLHSAAGLRMASGNTGTVLQAMRGSSAGGSGGCINIFLDRARFEQMQPGDVDAAIPADELGAVEFYSGATTTPPGVHGAGKELRDARALDEDAPRNPQTKNSQRMPNTNPQRRFWAALRVLRYRDRSPWQISPGRGRPGPCSRA